jgi:hypothetical protein
LCQEVGAASFSFFSAAKIGSSDYIKLTRGGGERAYNVRLLFLLSERRREEEEEREREKGKKRKLLNC